MIAKPPHVIGGGGEKVAGEVVLCKKGIVVVGAAIVVETEMSSAAQTFNAYGKVDFRLYCS